jgi:hypothetical protein
MHINHHCVGMFVLSPSRMDPLKEPGPQKLGPPVSYEIKAALGLSIGQVTRVPAPLCLPRTATLKSRLSYLLLR